MTLGRAAWIAILLIIAGVQGFRGVWFDGALFALTAVALTLDALGLLPRPVVGRVLPHPFVMLAGLTVVGAVLVLVPRHGIAAGVVVGALGVATVVFAWPDRPASARDEWTPATRRTAIAWAVIALALCLWELAYYVLGSFAPGGREAFPALSDLVNPIMDTVVGRSVVVAVWLVVGWGLARRVVSR